MSTFNRQEAFDIAVKGVTAQGCASYDQGIGCLYWGPNGTKCAVGFLIPDELYSPNLENKIPTDDSFDKVAEKLGWTTDDREFLVRLQRYTHDEASDPGGAAGFAELFKRYVKRFAATEGLTVPVLDPA